MCGLCALIEVIKPFFVIINRDQLKLESNGTFGKIHKTRLKFLIFKE